MRKMIQHFLCIVKKEGSSFAKIMRNSIYQFNYFLARRRTMTYYKSSKRFLLAPTYWTYLIIFKENEKYAQLILLLRICEIRSINLSKMWGICFRLFILIRMSLNTQLIILLRTIGTVEAGNTELGCNTEH